MPSLSTVEGNTSNEIDIRFVIKECLCGELADVKITNSNKNKNRGRIYYICKRSRCGTLLGWCKIASIQQAPNSIATLEECSTSLESVHEVNMNREVNMGLEVPWTWKKLLLRKALYNHILYKFH